MVEKTVGWGVLGAGIIAHKPADAVARTAGSRLVAVASNTPGKGAAFAEKWGCEPAPDYQALAARADVDIIYVATTHNLHEAAARIALEAGKAALVEKPFTVNAAEARALVDIARAKRLFLMEAMWVRFLPSIRRLRDLVRDGAIGEASLIEIAFGPTLPPKYQGRLHDPALAGGATLDLGVYPLTFANFIFGETPVRANSLMRPAATGVDATALYQLDYASGRLATIAASFALPMPARATIYGDKGRIEFPGFQQGRMYTIHRRVDGGAPGEETVETIAVENDENGFTYQVVEAADAVRTGRLESETMPLDETVATMALMDEMRADWGLKYPFE